MNMVEVEKPGIVGNHSIFEGTRGRVGGTVFRLVNGVTIASRRPRSPKTESSKQKEGRDRFRLAAAFARKELMDPARREIYQAMFQHNPRKLRNSYTAAITYYLNNIHTEKKVASVTSELQQSENTRSAGKPAVVQMHLLRKSREIILRSRPPLRRSSHLRRTSLELLISVIKINRHLGQWQHYIESG